MLQLPSMDMSLGGGLGHDVKHAQSHGTDQILLDSFADQLRDSLVHFLQAPSWPCSRTTTPSQAPKQMQRRKRTQHEYGTALAYRSRVININPLGRGGSTTA